MRDLGDQWIGSSASHVPDFGLQMPTSELVLREGPLPSALHHVGTAFQAFSLEPFFFEIQFTSHEDHLFKLCHSVVVSIVRLCSHHHNFRTFLSSQKETSSPLAVTPHSTPLQPMMFSVSRFAYFAHFVLNQIVCDLLWPLSLSIGFQG